MGRSGSYKAKSSPPLASSVRGAPPLPSARNGIAGQANARIAELEAQLAAAAQALQSQRSSHAEDSTSFEKTLSRLAQSERSLSQTKARLVDAETLARSEQARAEALSVELAASKATAAAEIAAARESASAAEAREQQALAAARAARFGEAANGAELDELQGKLSDLHAQHVELASRHTEWATERARYEVELAEARAHHERVQRELEHCRAEVAAAQERNAELTHERTRQLGVLASLEVLAREIAQLTTQAATATTSLPEVEAWLGRDVEAKHARATVRPEGIAVSASKASRASSAPEIVVDGLKLEP